jgi:hypothetical protein
LAGGRGGAKGGVIAADGAANSVRFLAKGIEGKRLMYRPTHKGPNS